MYLCLNTATLCIGCREEIKEEKCYSMPQYNPNVFIPNHQISVSMINGQGDTVCELYQINPHHRDGSPQKSQWTINNREEVEVFGWSMSINSISDDYYWGVFWDGVLCNTLGVTPHRLNSKIARFECTAQPRVWHGYPVDYVNDPQHDCPGYDVLKKWAGLGIITKPQIAKLIGGQGWKG